MLHMIEHTLEHCIRLVPFLFLTYLAMEFLEHKAGDKTARMVRKAGAFGPLIGGMAGVVPQCGFSAAASNLYAGRIISLGTLLAIYLSTSDEMLPILISNQDKVSGREMLGILGLKALIGVVVGFVVDAVLRRLGRNIQGGEHPYGQTEGNKLHTHSHEHSHEKYSQEAVHSHGEHDHKHIHGHEEHSQEVTHSQGEHNHEHIHNHEEHNQETAHNHGEHNHEHGHSHEEHHREEHYHIHDLCEHEHCNCEKDGVFLSAVKHTLKITFFIILFTFGIELLLHIVGEDVLAALISDRPILGPVIAGIVGLVPNCASSVAITQLYVDDIIGLGTMMAGLLVNAGIGMLVLFRVNPNKCETLKIMGLLYGIGVVIGIVIELIM